MPVAQQFETVADYMTALSPTLRDRLHPVLEAISRQLPEAELRISYQIPSFRLGGHTVVFAAGWAKHIAMYPVPAGDEAFQQMIAPYRASKGTLKFPHSAPVPYDVVRAVVDWAVRESSLRA